jgi:hypothetical protein
MQPTLKGWEQNKSKWTVEGIQSRTLTKGEINIFFSVKKLQLKEIEIYFTSVADVFIKKEGSVTTIQSLNETNLELLITQQKTKNKITLKPGETFQFSSK